MKNKLNKLVESQWFSILTILVCVVYLALSFFEPDIPMIFRALWTIFTLVIVFLQAYSIVKKKGKMTVRELTSEEFEIVKQLILSEENVKAIKKIREYTHLDLVSAKKFYEECKNKIDKK